MKIIIISEGGNIFGYGHISRCLSFYDAFITRGYDVVMLIDGDESIYSFLGNRCFEIINWHRGINKLLKSIMDSDVVFLDSLMATQGDVDYIEKFSSLFVVIDDYVRRKYSNTIIIDWTANVEKSNKHIHNIDNFNLLLLGIEYSVLRDPFTIKSNYIVSNLNRILIIMGGSDIRQLTLPLITCITQKYPELEIYAVLGAGLVNRKQVRQEVNDKVHLLESVDATIMRDNMLLSDLVISAGGQTLYELAALNVPTIPIQVIDNQGEDLYGLKDLGFFDDIYSWNDPQLFFKILRKIDELKPIDKRSRYFAPLKNIGRGIDKIINKIEEVYTNGRNRE